MTGHGHSIPRECFLEGNKLFLTLWHSNFIVVIRTHDVTLRYTELTEHVDIEFPPMESTAVADRQQRTCTAL